MEISAPTVDVKWGGGSTLGKFPHGPILTEMKWIIVLVGAVPSPQQS